MSLGETIRQARMDKGLSLRETARRVDMSNSYLSQLENGHNTRPNFEILNKIATVLGIDYFELFQETNFYKETLEKHVGDTADNLMENYNRVREIKGLTIYEEYTFSLEKLFSEGTKLTYDDDLLNEVDKNKILTLIDTILK